MTARSDAQIAWRALGVVGVLVGGGLVLAANPPPSWRAEIPAASAAPRASRRPIANSPAAPTREPLELTAEERERGHWECATPDPGDGRYAPVERLPRGGLVQIPRSPPREDGTFDVVLHFHGFAPVRKAVVLADAGIVFAGWDFGNGTDAYVAALRESGVVDRMMSDVGEALARLHGPSARVRHWGLSAWSAGYAAVGLTLRARADRFDAVVLLDGLHAGFRGGDKRARAIDEASLETFVRFAERAKQGGAVMVVTHSKIATEDYASTTETARVLLSHLGEKLVAAEPTTDPLGLRSFVDAGGFHLRAYGGTDKRAHCDHTRHMTWALRDVVRPAWGD